MTDRTRLLPLAGVAAAALTAAAFLTMGSIPDTDAGTAKLLSFYAAKHARVAAGGWLLGLAAIFLALFGVAVWARIRAGGRPLLGVVALVGTALAATGQITAANTYMTLGRIGHESGLDPAALQAWHISGSTGGIDGGSVLLLGAVAVAGIAGRALPRWLAWPAAVLAVLQLTPLGFFASLVGLLWTAVAGIALTIRPTAGDRAIAHEAAPQPAFGGR